MVNAVIAFVLGLFKVFLERGKSATTEAEQAGAAKQRVADGDAAVAVVAKAVDAGRAADRVQPVDGVLPDDGFRRD